MSKDLYIECGKIVIFVFVFDRFILFFPCFVGRENIFRFPLKILIDFRSFHVDLYFLISFDYTLSAALIRRFLLVFKAMNRRGDIAAAVDDTRGIASVYGHDRRSA